MRGAVFAASVAMVAAWTGKVEARSQADVSFQPDSRVKMTIGSCFENLPETGYAPVDVTVTNNSGETQQWKLKFTSPAYTMGRGAETSEFTVSVENNGTRTISLIVPLQESRGGPPLSVNVHGYGQMGGGSEAMLAARSYSGKTLMPYVVMAEPLGTSIWTSVQRRLESDGQDLEGSLVNPDELPDDWRGLSGVAGMWLSLDELNSLSAAQRYAVQTWVRAGGWLVLCKSGEAPQDFRAPGFGHVTTLAGSPSEAEVVAVIQGLPRSSDQAEMASALEFVKESRISPNVPLLFAFMIVFAVVVGPVNVFGFTQKRRVRLFWTTPLISVCASAVLMAMIIAKDGTGGHGVRNATVFVFPDTRNAVVRQEQLSRSGLLLNASFQTRDPVWMRQLDMSTYGNTQNNSRSLENEGTAFSGEWFASRSVQGQRLVGVTPTRAEVTVVNAKDFGAGSNSGVAPEVVSSFEGTLDTLSYTDDYGNRWVGHDVHTGVKQTLTEVKNVGTYMVNPHYAPSQAAGQFSYVNGYFVATASRSSGLFDTLGSVRWQDEPVTYVGVMTKAGK